MKSISQLRLYIVSVTFGIFFFCSPAISLAETPPDFDSRSAVLDMKELTVDKKDRYEDVRLKLNFDTGRFELLSFTPVENNDTGLTSTDFCVDRYPQLACTELGRQGGASQFSLGSSCRSSFPQQTYLAEASTGEFCASLGSCGACAFSLSDKARSGKNVDNAGNINIEDIVSESIQSILNAQSDADTQ